MKINVLVVDDEPLARARLRRLLSNMADVEVVGEARNGREAIDIAAELMPTLILMDINMPEVNGLDAAAQILSNCRAQGGVRAPSVVFCTAYDSFAIRAFELNASAYLLKPVSSSDLESALSNASQLSQIQLDALEQLTNRAKPSLSIQSDGVTEKVPIAKIAYFRVEGKHVVAALIADSGDVDEIFVNYSLRELESLFEADFQRVHRGAMVNKESMARLIRDNNGGTSIELKATRKKFTVSRRLLGEVKKCF